MSTDSKLSEAQISKIIQSGGFLGSLLSELAGPIMKAAVPKKYFSSIKTTIAAASAIDAEIQKENKWFRNDCFNNFEWRNEWYKKNCSSS